VASAMGFEKTADFCDLQLTTLDQEVEVIIKTFGSYIN
jgi:hypothetical protein